jgi:hypothetical protein
MLLLLLLLGLPGAMEAMAAGTVVLLATMTGMLEGLCSSIVWVLPCDATPTPKGSYAGLCVAAYQQSSLSLPVYIRTLRSWSCLCICLYPAGAMGPVHQGATTLDTHCSMHTHNKHCVRPQQHTVCDACCCCTAGATGLARLGATMVVTQAMRH